MKLRRWVQVLILILTIITFVYGVVLFSRIENSININIFDLIKLIIVMPMFFINLLVIDSSSYTLFNNLKVKLEDLIIK